MANAKLHGWDGQWWGRGPGVGTGAPHTFEPGGQASVVLWTEVGALQVHGVVGKAICRRVPLGTLSRAGLPGICKVRRT